MRLADFAQARLRDLTSRESAKHGLNLSSFFVHKDQSSDIVAHAERYQVSLTPLNREAAKHSEELQDVQVDHQSGYTLASSADGILIWKQGSGNALLFPLPDSLATTALFVPCYAGSPTTQPGLVTINCENGCVTYWESINRALEVGSGETSALQNLGTTGNAKISLARQETIEFVESVDPFGLVVSTSEGRFFLINLRDDIGKRRVTITSMSSGMHFLSRLRSMGAFARDITSLRAGKLVNEDMNRELFVLNKFGDTTIWHVGQNGYNDLKSEHKFGALLSHQMNILYPNCLATLQVHDIDSQDSKIQVLASFAPQPGSTMRYFVILTDTPSVSPSVRRLQTYFSDDGNVDENTSLRTCEGNLVVAFHDAITLFKKVDDFGSSGSVEKPWEETLSLKSEARLLGMASRDGDIFTVPTSMGILNIQLQSATNSISTTKERLEQAVFETQPQSPLDLTKWSSFEAIPDSDAPFQLAREIANAETLYLPAQLPNLKEHLALRVSKLNALYQLAPSTEVREIAQAAAAGLEFLTFYDSLSDSTVSNAIDFEVRAIKSGVTNLKGLLTKDLTLIPQVLIRLTSKKRSETADLVLSVFRTCCSNGLGLPDWASQGPLREALESLSSQAADTRDPDLLAQTTEMLCAVYASGDLSVQAADNKSIKRLLQELSKVKGMSSVAIEIATKYRVFSALAPLEVAIWVSECERGESSNSEGLKSVSSHISEFGTPYASAVFSTCVESGNAALLVEQLAPLHDALVRDYLSAHQLHHIAWTLNPGTAESTEELKRATVLAKTAHQVRLYASLYKLSAFTTKSGSVSDAQTYLDLVAAQDLLKKQLLARNDLPESFSNLQMAKAGISKLNDQLLDRSTAVELLALAPPQAIPDQNNNFILGFKLVRAQDFPRQRLLVQELICHTNWERIASSQNSDRVKRLKQSLFFHTYCNVPPAYANLIRNFASSFVENQASEIDPEFCGPWNQTRALEFNIFLTRAQSIAEKYRVAELLEELLPKGSEMELDG